MIISATQINSAQFEAIQGLKDICHQHDGSVPALYPMIMKQARQMPTHILMYENNQLIGFAAIYFFFEKACELSLMVHPAHRHKGHAKALMEPLYKLLKQNNIPEIIFSAPAVFESYWQDPKYQYHHSEYKMRLDNLTLPALQRRKLNYHDGDIKMLTRLCTLDRLGFPDGHKDHERRLTNFLELPNYNIYVGEIKEGLHKTIISKAHMYWSQDAAVLSDIVVHPKYQKKGYGREIIAYCLTKAYEKKYQSVELDVETNNLHALELYSQFGFKVINSAKFWSWKFN